MKIGLIDVDSKIPNLALMKISTYYKSIGYEVELIKECKIYDKLYASAIFTKSKQECEKILEVYENKVEIGGTGWDITKKLSKEIDKCNLDYNLYDEKYWTKKLSHEPLKKKDQIRKIKYYLSVGVGFTRRGCLNKCSFCFVPKKRTCTI